MNRGDINIIAGIIYTDSIDLEKKIEMLEILSDNKEISIIQNAIQVLKTGKQEDIAKFRESLFNIIIDEIKKNNNISDVDLEELLDNYKKWEQIYNIKELRF